jgi:hypothetical protein
MQDLQNIGSAQMRDKCLTLHLIDPPNFCETMLPGYEYIDVMGANLGKFRYPATHGN